MNETRKNDLTLSSKCLNYISNNLERQRTQDAKAETNRR